MNRRVFLAAVTALPFLPVLSVRGTPTSRATMLTSTPVDLSRLLGCIALVETGGHDRTGRSGETSKWQLSPTVRKQWKTYLPDCWWTDNYIAETHLTWLTRQLFLNSVHPSPFNLALAWNAGLDTVLRGRCQIRHYDYARRVTNLYDDASCPQLLP